MTVAAAHEAPAHCLDDVRFTPKFAHRRHDDYHPRDDEQYDSDRHDHYPGDYEQYDSEQAPGAATIGWSCNSLVVS